MSEAKCTSELLAACQNLLAHWDRGGPETLKNFEGDHYWSPASRMVDTEFVAAIRAAVKAEGQS